MPVNIHGWTSLLGEKLKNHFGPRLLFMGLQGSYRRGEAGPQSDIDIAVILDRLSPEDLSAHRTLIQTMPHGEKACGFIAGKDIFALWPKADLFQFKNDTQALIGALDGLIPKIGREDIRAYLSLSCANLYHAAVHSYLYDETADPAPLRKPLFFLLQGLVYWDRGAYAASKKELLPLLAAQERFLLCGAQDEAPGLFFEKLIPYLGEKLSLLAR